MLTFLKFGTLSRISVYRNTHTHTLVDKHILAQTCY